MFSYIEDKKPKFQYVCQYLFSDISLMFQDMIYAPTRTPYRYKKLVNDNNIL